MSSRKSSKNITAFCLSLVFFLWITSTSKVSATESGVSFYVPGLYGDIGVAIPPPAGVYLLSTSIYYPAKTPNPIFPNAIDKKLEADIFAQLLRGFWVPETKIFGAKALFGFRLQILDIELDAELETPFGDIKVNEKNKDYGDLGIIPLSLYWQSGNFYANLYEVISAPTAKYDPESATNTALGHWVFDTVLSMTWLDPTTGIEISAVPGIIYNAENRETNYKSGTEFHMDVILNWHVSASLAIGMHGSVYHQLTDDKGADPSLGGFKGRSYSVGPSITWHKNIGEQKYLLSAKWLHEFDALNKLEGDLMLFSAGMKF